MRPRLLRPNKLSNQKSSKRLKKEKPFFTRQLSRKETSSTVKEKLFSTKMVASATRKKGIRNKKVK